MRPACSSKLRTPVDGGGSAPRAGLQQIFQTRRDLGQAMTEADRRPARRAALNDGRGRARVLRATALVEVDRHTGWYHGSSTSIRVASR
jgi:hypothetical protein